MVEVDLIVTVASWEPRFILGMERTLKQSASSRLLVYFFGEYARRTEQARTRLKILADDRGIEFEEQEMSFRSPVNTWNLLREHFGSSSTSGHRRVLMDLTTMPRDVIWSVLFWLESSAADVRYVYNHPLAYGTSWLARNPDDPRLIYKLSGELKLGYPTALVAVTGFDADRCLQAIDFYEPTHVLLAGQKGRQYDNLHRNVGARFNPPSVPCDHIAIDAFSHDHGYDVLRVGVEALVRQYNVIFCSFGPKPSAIALFRLQREYPQTALAYIACREYSNDYSTGLGEAIEGTITWRHGAE